MERRRAERKSAKINVRASCGEIFCSGVIQNISESGIFMKTDDCLPPGTGCVVYIRSKSGILSLKSKVRWCRKCEGKEEGMGLEIIGPSVRYLDYFNDLK